MEDGSASSSGGVSISTEFLLSAALLIVTLIFCMVCYNRLEVSLFPLTFCLTLRQMSQTLLKVFLATKAFLTCALG